MARLGPPQGMLDGDLSGLDIFQCCIVLAELRSSPDDDRLAADTVSLA